VCVWEKRFHVRVVVENKASRGGKKVSRVRDGGKQGFARWKKVSRARGGGKQGFTR